MSRQRTISNYNGMVCVLFRSLHLITNGMRELNETSERNKRTQLPLIIGWPLITKIWRECSLLSLIEIKQTYVRVYFQLK